MKAEEILKNRNQLNWSQKDLADKSGVTLQSVEDFESGIREPSTPISRLLTTTFKKGEYLNMKTRLNYVAWDEGSEILQQIAKKLFQEMEYFVDTSFENSREKSLTITKLEETWMWLGKTIKVEQEKRIDSKKLSEYKTWGQLEEENGKI